MLSDKYIILLAFGCSFIITYLAIPKIIHFANKLRLHDNPGERASHKGRIPVFGGIAIFAGVIFPLLFFKISFKCWFNFASFGSIKYPSGSTTCFKTFSFPYLACHVFYK